MPFKPGESGNPSGDSRTARKIREILWRACAQEDFKRVRQGIEKTLDSVAEGDLESLEFVRDTTDGRPAQAVQVMGDEDHPLVHKIIREVVAAKP